MIAAVREHGLSILPWSKEAEILRRRLGWLYRGLGDPWPSMEDDTLLERLEDWLLPFLTGEAQLDRIPGRVLKNGLMSLVPFDLQRSVDQLAPTHFEAPTGSHVPIRYDAEEPVIAVRVQELFGLGAHPSIADGKVPLLLGFFHPHIVQSRSRAIFRASGKARGPMCALICAGAIPNMSGRKILPMQCPRAAPNRAEPEIFGSDGPATG